MSSKKKTKYYKINVVHIDPSPLNSLTTVFHFLTQRGIFIKASRQRNSGSNCHLLLAPNTVNILYLRRFHFYSSVLDGEGNLPLSIALILILIPLMLLPVLHSKYSERKQENIQKGGDGQKTLQICFNMTKDSSDMYGYAVSDRWRKATLD